MVGSYDKIGEKIKYCNRCKEYTWIYDRGKIVVNFKLFSLLTWNTFIGQFVHWGLGKGSESLFLSAACFKEHENLV